MASISDSKANMTNESEKKMNSLIWRCVFLLLLFLLGSLLASGRFLRREKKMKELKIMKAEFSILDEHLKLSSHRFNRLFLYTHKCTHLLGACVYVWYVYLLSPFFFSSHKPYLLCIHIFTSQRKWADDFSFFAVFMLMVYSSLYQQ